MENSPTGHLIESLKLLSATFLKEPHDPEFTNHYFQEAQANERAIDPEEMLSGEKQDLLQTLNYLLLLIPKEKRFGVIRRWLGFTALRLGIQERE
jgi:hypothetical protein